MGAIKRDILPLTAPSTRGQPPATPSAEAATAECVSGVSFTLWPSVGHAEWSVSLGVCLEGEESQLFTIR